MITPFISEVGKVGSWSNFRNAYSDGQSQRFKKIIFCHFDIGNFQDKLLSISLTISID